MSGTSIVLLIISSTEYPAIRHRPKRWSQSIICLSIYLYLWWSMDAIYFMSQSLNIASPSEDKTMSANRSRDLVLHCWQLFNCEWSDWRRVEINWYLLFEHLSCCIRTSVYWLELHAHLVTWEKKRTTEYLSVQWRRQWWIFYSTFSRGELATCWYILLSGSIFIDSTMYLPRAR